MRQVLDTVVGAMPKRFRTGAKGGLVLAVFGLLAACSDEAPAMAPFGGIPGQVTGGAVPPPVSGMTATGGVMGGPLAGASGGIAGPAAGASGGVAGPVPSGGALAGAGDDAGVTGGTATDADGSMGGPAPDFAGEVNVAVEGPHAYDTFTEGAGAPEYAEGLVYYPTDADGPFPAMVLSPGLTANNTDYEVWGRVLASHGIVALLMQPTSTLDWNDVRAVDLQAGVGVVRGALNESGPLAGKIDTAHVGIMGQSMGGGGTLIAANDIGEDIQAAIPMEPYAPGSSFPNITAPTLVIAAELDDVASVSANAFVHYGSIPDSTVKIYMEGAGADHYYSTDRYENDFDMNARYAVAFLKVYLEGDTRYEPYLYGAEHEAVADQLSRYLTSQP